MEIDVKTGKLTCRPVYQGAKITIEAKGDVGESRIEVKTSMKKAAWTWYQDFLVSLCEKEIHTA